MTPTRFTQCLTSIRWTQNCLARLLDCNAGTIAQWASGQSDIPEIVAAWLETLAQVHDVNPPPLRWKPRQPPLAAPEAAHAGHVIDYQSVWRRIQDKLTANLPDWKQRASSLGQHRYHQRRDTQHQFSDDEVFEGLLLALLSNSTNWAVVERAMPALSRQFDDFRLGSYARRSEAQIEETYRWFLANRTASTVLRKGLQRLREAAEILEGRSRESGGLHSYLENLLNEHGGNPIELAVALGGAGHGGAHHLPGFGIALAAEFLKNVGYDVAKPDRHINRAVGSFGWVSFRNWPDRRGTKAPTATEPELIRVMREMASCARSVGQSACFIDNVIWMLCARSGLYLCNEALTTIGRTENF